MENIRKKYYDHTTERLAFQWFTHMGEINGIYLQYEDENDKKGTFQINTDNGAKPVKDRDFILTHMSGGFERVEVIEEEKFYNKYSVL